MAVSLRAALFSVSYAALGDRGHGRSAGANGARDKSKMRAASACSDHRSRSVAPASTAPAQRADRAGQRRRSQVARRPAPQAAPKPFGVSQDARTGTVGVYANSTSIATKTNTPLVNIPQSITVVTKEFIRDQVFRASPT